MTLKVWGELVPCTEFIETDNPEKAKELWVRVKYSPVLKGLIEGHIDYKCRYAHRLYLWLIEDPTRVIEFEDMSDFLSKQSEFEK
jgi:hypothetical protein